MVGIPTREQAPGRAWFTVEGKEYALEPTLDGDQLFFVFKDRTAPRETYGAGRFLAAAAPRDGQVVLDFNRAYNPPCAFSPYATCPLPLPQNVLPIRIEAGERAGDIERATRLTRSRPRRAQARPGARAQRRRLAQAADVRSQARTEARGSSASEASLRWRLPRPSPASRRCGSAKPSGGPTMIRLTWALWPPMAQNMAPPIE